MITNIRYMATILLVGAAFSFGYYVASAKYRVDMAELEARQAKETKELTDEYRTKEREAAERLAQSWSELEKTRSESVDLRSDVERVRKLADDYKRKLSSAGADSCVAYRKHAVTGADLVERGAELLERCVSLAEKCSLERDAVAKIVGSKCR